MFTNLRTFFILLQVKNFKLQDRKYDVVLEQNQTV